jgi:hypothetical protein
MPIKIPKKGSIDRRSSADMGHRGSECPTIAQLLAVIAEYNKAHELDLAELNNGAVVHGANEFLENLYFAAASAARALRPIMSVELGVRSLNLGDRSSEMGDGKRGFPRIIPQVLGSVEQSSTAAGIPTANSELPTSARGGHQ